MKKLIKRLSKISDSSQYTLLRANTSSPSTRPTRRLGDSFRGKKDGVPVYVGEEMERFLVSAEVLNHPIFVTLLNKSAQEYGYEQKGVLRIHCNVFVFERVLEAVRIGCHETARDLHDLFSSASDEMM
ncbi:hypothetical protein LIER_27808 [Lithospermum erythrorhizon]|uniref:SAUR family protein n=1 Tax=Lithospermum erythrorhizon TaxID=34254 RepID=A0AAV3REI8_LITER